MQFLKNSSSELPRTIEESIRLLKNASVGFCDSWLDGDIDEAKETSVEAFEILDHIQNELLRRRDDLKKENRWSDSQYKVAMGEVVGEIVAIESQQHETNFLQNPVGDASFPDEAIPETLTMEKALNKLKHRVSHGINFNISPAKEHYLYIFTSSGMGQPAAISKIHMKKFCQKCKSASKAFNEDNS